MDPNLWFLMATGREESVKKMMREETVRKTFDVMDPEVLRLIKKGARIARNVAELESPEKEWAAVREVVVQLKWERLCRQILQK
jgi:hypothetical protein